MFNILLQVLDDGQITDSQGRRIDFKNTVLIMTSNCGAENIITPKKLGFGSQETEDEKYKYMKNSVMEEVKRSFKPEFLNRIDEIIVFHALEKTHIRQIVEIMLRGIDRRTRAQMNIGLEVSEAVQDYLIEKGYDPKYGARPLRRTIQSCLEDSMAEQVLDGKIKEGDTVKAEMCIRDRRKYGR